MLFCLVASVSSSSLFAFHGSPRDSIVVDGMRWNYLADVAIDTTKDAPVFFETDWWLGVGWMLQANASAMDAMVLPDMALSSPSVMLERQWRLTSGKGRVGIRLGYHQPWMLDVDNVNEHVKGWIQQQPQANTSPVLAVLLIPDNLADERDTVLAPIATGNAMSLGFLWEASMGTTWRPLLQLDMDVLRPSAWKLLSPPEPGVWSSIESEDTFEATSFWQSRLRIHAGMVWDLGRVNNRIRSSSQLRFMGYWAPQGSTGLQAMLVVSPTWR